MYHVWTLKKTRSLIETPIPKTISVNKQNNVAEKLQPT